MLIARTPFIARLASLFAYDRKLRVDTKSQYVRLSVRSYRLRRREERVPFSAVETIQYRYGHVPTDFVPSEHGAQISDRLDSFTVVLQLRGRPDPLPLFRFAGAGYDMTGVSGTLLGDDIVDSAGAREDESHDFVTLLRQCLKVPVRSGLQQKVAEVMAKTARPCPKCSRRISQAAPICIYCGTKFPAPA